jgi:hypothetical protein
MNHDSLNFELTPEQQAKPEPVFLSIEEYHEFCRIFVEDVGPELEEQRQARQQSEAEAKLRWIG